jgi:hypothetical protein
MLPWPKLNRLVDLADSETLNAEARRVYETKRKLLELGDDATVKQWKRRVRHKRHSPTEGFDLEISSAN